MKLSIIIVNYNVTNLLRNCLISIEKFVQNVDYEVIVIDNASTDTSWESLISEFPKVQFIASPKNWGFSKANNLAVNSAKGEYILLLNPDTELEGNYMQEIIEFADSKENFGCIGVRMHDKEGVFLPESKRSVPDIFNSFEKLFSPFFSKNSSHKSYYRNDIAENTIAEVEVITGAFLLTKRKIYQKIGGLDERYFMYGEDIDLCYTFLQNGYENWYFGKYSILHIKGESTVKDIKYVEDFYNAMEIFVEKYYKRKSFFQYLFLRLGLVVRKQIALLQIKK